jgi:type I restriction enzyme M protein
VTNRKPLARRGKVQLVDAGSFFKKMRKSLGNKRNEICEAQRQEITRLYGGFAAGEHVRILDNDDLGHRRITVERPLRLNFAVTPERLARLREAGPFAALATSRKRKDAGTAEAEAAAGAALQQDILAALQTLAPLGVLRSRTEFAGRLRAALNAAGFKAPAPLFAAILGSLSERDEGAEICTGGQGQPEPDPDLRDFENVPLQEDVAGYMAREVLPHVPDAWVDESKTKVGYELNLNRYFYRYTPPRPLAEIEAELRQIEREIAGMLGGVAE